MRKPGRAGPSAPRTVSGRTTVLTQIWDDIVWAHWPVDVDAVAAILPDGLEVDTYEGHAWVGFIPFTMRDLRPSLRGHRGPAIPGVHSFAEVNVRTYVIGPEGPGVWFCSLDATSALGVAVAQTAWSLPYIHATITAELHQENRRWTIERRNGISGSLSVTLGDAVAGDDRDRFLVERYALYAKPRWTSKLLWCPVRHEPWSLRSAEITEMDVGLVHAAGFDPLGEPLVLAGEAATVSVGLPKLVRGR